MDLTNGTIFQQVGSVETSGSTHPSGFSPRGEIGSPILSQGVSCEETASSSSTPKEEDWILVSYKKQPVEVPVAFATEVPVAKATKAPNKKSSQKKKGKPVKVVLLPQENDFPSLPKVKDVAPGVAISEPQKKSSEPTWLGAVKAAAGIAAEGSILPVKLPAKAVTVQKSSEEEKPSPKKEVKVVKPKLSLAEKFCSRLLGLAISHLDEISRKPVNILNMFNEWEKENFSRFFYRSDLIEKVAESLASSNETYWMSITSEKHFSACFHVKGWRPSSR
jgi:hypothetical protein